MLDHVIGLLLLGLGLNKTIYTPNPNVQGDSTEISQEVPPPGTGAGAPTPGFKPPFLQNTFRLNPQSFESGEEGPKGRTASMAGGPKRAFNARAFGLGVMKMQENFNDQVEASREGAKREFELHKTEFKRQLGLIHDTKKQAMLDKLNTNCQAINDKRTGKMKEMLSRLTLILTNVTNRAASASASGKDTSSVDTAVTTAQSAIADAQTAVAAQAGSTCTITITSEKNLKTDVSHVVSGLQQSLKSAYDKVLAARKAVGDAIKALSLVTGEKLEKPKPTGTGEGPG